MCRCPQRSTAARRADPGCCFSCSWWCSLWPPRSGRSGSPTWRSPASGPVRWPSPTLPAGRRRCRRCSGSPARCGGLARHLACRQRAHRGVVQRSRPAVAPGRGDPHRRVQLAALHVRVPAGAAAQNARCPARAAWATPARLPSMRGSRPSSSPMIAVRVVLRIAIALKASHEAVGSGQLIANAVLLDVFLWACDASREPVAEWFTTISSNELAWAGALGRPLARDRRSVLLRPHRGADLRGRLCPGHHPRGDAADAEHRARRHPAAHADLRGDAAGRPCRPDGRCAVHDGVRSHRRVA